MKRSEMIMNIINYLDSEIDQPKEMHEYMANKILDIIEDHGMLPPEDTSEIYYSGEEPGGYHPRRWEEE